MKSENIPEITPKDLVELGHSHSVHGLKGHFVFHLYSHENTILKKNSKIFLKLKENPFPLKSFHIDELKIGNKIIAKLSGVDNRTQAELLLPFQIYFPRSEFPKLKSTNEYYIQDLIGLNVIDFHQGNIVGKVHGHYFNGAQTILTLTDLNGEDIDLLFLEQFVPEVNISEGYLKAVLPFYVDQN